MAASIATLQLHAPLRREALVSLGEDAPIVVIPHTGSKTLRHGVETVTEADLAAINREGYLRLHFPAPKIHNVTAASQTVAARLQRITAALTYASVISVITHST